MIHLQHILGKRLLLPNIILGSILVALLAANNSYAGTWDIGGQFTLESRYFPYSPEFTHQKNIVLSTSASLSPEIVYEWKDERITFTPFARADSDDKRRSHLDIREASWLHIGSNWDIIAGLSKVFWGVTESAHLVDIINQTDSVEDITGEDKLGQPMLNLNIDEYWGSLNMFILPGFRTRTFTANNARLHGSFAIDTGTPAYQSSQKQRHIDWAIRWSRSFGNMDIALSHFQGTSREAILRPQLRSSGIVFTPYYTQIAQTGLELQWTADNTLWKAEAISRSGQGQRFYATVSGFEHTLYAIADSSIDMGLLLEYQYDNRNPRLAPFTISNHDIFAGFRLVMNDTQDTTLLLGGIYDHQTQATFTSIEAERRITDHLKAELNARLLTHVPIYDALALIRSDDYIELKLRWFF